MKTYSNIFAVFFNPYTRGCDDDDVVFLSHSPEQQQHRQPWDSTFK
jgi:hypothetical protein